MLLIRSGDGPDLGSTGVGLPFDIDGMEAGARRASQDDRTGSNSSIGARESFGGCSLRHSIDQNAEIDGSIIRIGDGEGEMDDQEIRRNHGDRLAQQWNEGGGAGRLICGYFREFRLK